MPQETSRPLVLAAVDDIFFSAKIQSAANAIGVRLLPATDPGQLDACLECEVPRLIIFDLNSRKIDPLQAVRDLRADRRFDSTSAIGFLSHVQVELEEAARGAGFDRILPKSQFSSQLPEILREFGMQPQA